MTIFRAKNYLFLCFLVIIAPALAQNPAPASDNGRDASFLPPSGPAPAAVLTQPVATAPVNPTVPSVTLPTVAPPVSVPMPSVNAPVSTQSAVIVPAPAVAVAPATPPSAAPAIVSPPAATPAAVAKPVETANVAAIDSESIGLLNNSDGGLGADIWKGSNRALVTKLYTLINLPTASRTLNQLSHRLLLTTAAAPEGTTDGRQTLTSMRAEKLLALGDADAAWKLVTLAKPDQIDEITLRLVAEAALLGSQRDDVCAKLQDIVKTHNGADWQKLMLVCQLHANDTKAAQLTLDLLHAQNVKDDTYFFVAEKNIIGGNKQLPRQLTPVRPLTLALLRQTDLPLPGEIFVHPEASMIPTLLDAKAREEVTRIGLAERAAERGFIGGDELVKVYRSITFLPEVLANAANSSETGPRLHALLYQGALSEKKPQDRLSEIAKFITTSSPAMIQNAGGRVLAEMLGDIAPAPEVNPEAALIGYIYILAGKNDAALPWIKLAKTAAAASPLMAAQLGDIWPQMVFAGLVTESDFANDLPKWVETYVKNTDTKNDARARREQAGDILLLFEAAGYTVSNSVWLSVFDQPGLEKKIAPSTLFLERLRAASTSPRRGETVLLALAVAGNGNDISFISAVEIVRALRMTGLSADASLFARETANIILQPFKP